MTANFIPFLCILGMLWGCTTIKHGPQPEPESFKGPHFSKDWTIKGIDFTPFSSRGFLITPWRYQGEYDMIAQIHAVFCPSAELIEKAVVRPKKLKASPFYTREFPADTLKVYEWVHDDQWDLQEAMEKGYEFCNEKEADTLVEFKAIDKEHEPQRVSKVGKLEYTDYHFDLVISGYAIKRK